MGSKKRSVCGIEDENGEETDGEDYCYDCALNLAGEENMVREGGPMDSEGSRVCNGCGKILAVDLTLGGVESELEHFETYPPEDDIRHRRNLIDILEGIRSEEKESKLYLQAVGLVDEYLRNLNTKRK